MNSPPPKKNGMRIGIDYDGTYDRDPEFFNGIIALGTSLGHTFVIVTCRHRPDDPEDLIVIPGATVVYTGGQAKKPYMEMVVGWHVDIWMDDEPYAILFGR